MAAVCYEFGSLVESCGRLRHGDDSFLSQTHITSACAATVGGCLLDDVPFDLEFFILVFQIPDVLRQCSILAA